MAEFKVVWTSTAISQLRHVMEYWLDKTKNADYSNKILDRIDLLVKNISTNPYLYPKSKFKASRVCSLGHYSLYHNISESTLYIIAFWDNRQNPQKLKALITNS